MTRGSLQTAPLDFLIVLMIHSREDCVVTFAYIPGKVLAHPSPNDTIPRISKRFESVSTKSDFERKKKLCKVEF